MTDDEPLDLETLISELNTAANGVSKASWKLAKVTQEFENRVMGGTDGVELGIGARYDIAFDREVVAIYEEAQKAGERAPAEDIRQAMARERLRAKDPALVAEYARATTEIKALQQWISANRQVINARQTVINGLRAIGA